MHKIKLWGMYVSYYIFCTYLFWVRYLGTSIYTILFVHTLLTTSYSTYSIRKWIFFSFKRKDLPPKTWREIQKCRVKIWMAFLSFPSSSLLTFRVKCDKTRREYSILKDISKKMMWRILCQLFWLLKKKDSKIWKKWDILLSTTDNRPRLLAPISIFPILRALWCCCHSLSSFLFTMKHIEIYYQSTCLTWCESFITSLLKAIQFHVLCHFWNWIAFSRLMLVYVLIFVKLHVKWKFEAHFFQKFITHISLVLKEAILKEKKRTFIQTTKLWYKKTTLLLCTHYILQWNYRG